MAKSLDNLHTLAYNFDLDTCIEMMFEKDLSSEYFNFLKALLEENVGESPKGRIYGESKLYFTNMASVGKIVLITKLDNLSCPKEKVDLLFDFLLFPLDKFYYWNTDILSLIRSLTVTERFDFLEYKEKLDTIFRGERSVGYKGESPRTYLDESFIYNLISEDVENIDFLLEGVLNILKKVVKEKRFLDVHCGWYSVHFYPNYYLTMSVKLDFSKHTPILSPKNVRKLKYLKENLEKMLKSFKTPLGKSYDTEVLFSYFHQSSGFVSPKLLLGEFNQESIDELAKVENLLDSFFQEFLYTFPKANPELTLKSCFDSKDTLSSDFLYDKFHTYMIEKYPRKIAMNYIRYLKNNIKESFSEDVINDAYEGKLQNDSVVHNLYLLRTEKVI